jgi:hypothetical protein
MMLRNKKILKQEVKEKDTRQEVKEKDTRQEVKEENEREEDKDLKKRYNNNTLCIRKKNYKKGEFYKVSRSSIDYYLNCPTCSYLKEVKGINQVPSPGWSLNSCVDELSKNDMDRHRKNKTNPDILMIENLKLYHHEDLDNWRKMGHGVSYYDESTKFKINGLIDDVLINENDELVMMDVKSTSNNQNIISEENVFGNGLSYKRQLEFYGWLFKKNGFKVSNKGYLLYYNGDKKCENFEKTIRLKETLVPLSLDMSWIDSTIKEYYELLNSDVTPQLNENCDKCLNILHINNILKK